MVCTPAPCSVPDCISMVEGRGMCGMHLKRMQARGTTEPRVPSYVGQVHGSLVVRRRVGADRYGRAVVQLDCNCGNSVVWAMRKVRNPEVAKHCGCGGTAACVKAPGAKYGKWCTCLDCRRGRSADRRATGRRLVREAALERARLAGEPDEVAVERAMKGDMTGVRKVDMHEAALRMLKAGKSHTYVAEKLGLSDRTITRYSVKWRPEGAHTIVEAS